MLAVIQASIKTLASVVGLVPTLRRSHYLKKFYKLEKKIKKELGKPDEEKIDSFVDSYHDEYMLLLKYFSEEVKDAKFRK